MGDAILRQRSGVLGVGIVAKCGVLTPEQLIGLGKLAGKVGCLVCKLTTRQTLIFLIPEERLDTLRRGVEALGLRIGVFGEIVRNVKACAGSDELCRRSLSDVFELGGRLQEHYMNRPTPCDFKISLAGCQRGCTEPLCADYGVVATGADSYNVYLGGRGAGRTPQHATLVAEGLNAEGVDLLLSEVLRRYDHLAQPKERICATISRVGLGQLLPEHDLMERYRSNDDGGFLDFAGLEG